MTGHHRAERSATTSVVRWVRVFAVTFAASATLGWLARRWAEAQWDLAANGIVPVYEKSPLIHGLTITVTVGLALAVVVPLLRSGFGAIALLVCVGVGFGPLGLVVAPVFNSPSNWDGVDLRSTLWTWFGSLLLASLVAIAAHYLAAPAPPPIAGPIENAVGVAVMLLPLVALAGIPGDDEIFPWFMSMPIMLMTLGWGLLAGGVLAVGLLAVDPIRVSLLRFILACAIPAVSFWAYQRPGGAPEVPGWDYSDLAEVLTATLATALVVSAALGLALRLTGVGAHVRGTRRPVTETPKPAAAY
jgi:hypothetical protein